MKNPVTFPLGTVIEIFLYSLNQRRMLYSWLPSFNICENEQTERKRNNEESSHSQNESQNMLSKCSKYMNFYSPSFHFEKHQTMHCAKKVI
jgi:hypothetical protein